MKKSKGSISVSRCSDSPQHVLVPLTYSSNFFFLFDLRGIWEGKVMGGFEMKEEMNWILFSINFNSP